MNTPAMQAHKSAWHMGEYKGWDIFVVREGYVLVPSLKVVPLYLAVNYFTSDILTGTSLPELHLDVEEAIKNGSENRV